MATPTTRFVTASNKSSHLTGFRCAGSVPLLFPQLAPIGARVADSLIMTSMPTKAAMVELLTRRTSYGQDTSKLYQREESCKRWRAEHPAIPEDKAEAKERLQRFQAAVGSMHGALEARRHCRAARAVPGRQVHPLWRLRRWEEQSGAEAAAGAGASSSCLTTLDAARAQAPVRDPRLPRLPHLRARRGAWDDDQDGDEASYGSVRGRPRARSPL